ncbi:MAG: ATP-binding protein [Clostridiales bacterium]|jgi:DNA replication protein DnaC|nr:ATP-binding protein [Clostridiales bacterium]
MNCAKAESLPSLEQTMRALKLGGLAKEWRGVECRDPEQYLRELLDIEVREREASRMARMIKQAGFRAVKALDSFVWKTGIKIPNAITRKEMEADAFVKDKENLVFKGACGTGKTQRGTLAGFMASLRKVELLVLDEVGFNTFTRRPANCCFRSRPTVMSKRASSSHPIWNLAD